MSKVSDEKKTESNQKNDNKKQQKKLECVELELNFEICFVNIYIFFLFIMRKDIYIYIYL